LLIRFGFNTSVYVLASVLSRGVYFLLVPVFTRVLSPADYGTLAVATSYGAVLTVVLGCSMDSAITQMLQQAETRDEQATLLATLSGFWMVVSGGIALAVHLVGVGGHLDRLTGIPYRPFLQLVLLASYLSIFSAATQALFVTAQRPFRAAGAAVGQVLVTTLLSVFLVVYLREGVQGVLVANAAGAGVGVVIMVAVLFRLRPRRLSWSVLKKALSFSLPLVPHSASTWAISLSDRLVIQRNASASALGLYSLGGQFSMAVPLVTAGMNSAFYPIVNARLADGRGAADVPRLGTVFLLASTWIALAVGLIAPGAIRLLTPERFHGAGRVIPLLCVGYALQAVYLVWSRGTWYAMRTGWVPAITAVAAMANVGLNLLLVPRYGIMAAAADSAVTYLILALLHGYLANKLFPIRWQYRRWLVLLGVAGLWLLVGSAVQVRSATVGLALQMLILVVLFPLSLLAAGFLSRDDRRDLGTVVGRLRGAVFRSAVR
jgi:O-antigen/teichoic acid export membrane protein